MLLPGGSGPRQRDTAGEKKFPHLTGGRAKTGRKKNPAKGGVSFAES